MVSPQDAIPTLAFASLRMDKGEDLKYAYASIARYAAQKPMYFCYDIICKPEQIAEAYKLILLIKKRIIRENPQLNKENLSVGITIDFYQRPGAERMLQRLAEKGYNLNDFLDDNNWYDINPTREKNWTE